MVVVMVIIMIFIVIINSFAFSSLVLFSNRQKPRREERRYVQNMCVLRAWVQVCFVSDVVGNTNVLCFIVCRRARMEIIVYAILRWGKGFPIIVSPLAQRTSCLFRAYIYIAGCI